jgi:signal peptidase I
MRRRRIASVALQAIVLALLAVAFFMRTLQVSGVSMEPLIASGDYVLVDTLAYRLQAPKRGDVVAFRHDGETRRDLIKRVIGLPGERITVREGIVFVDGVRLEEPYVRDPDDRSFPALTVPPGSVYVLGDNRPASDDSRLFGPIPDSELIGRAIAVVWPPGKAARL